MGAVSRSWPGQIGDLQVGDLVKVCLIGSNPDDCEGIWVSVEEICSPWGVVGCLANEPAHQYQPPLAAGDLVAVNLFQIVDWTRVRGDS